MRVNLSGGLIAFAMLIAVTFLGCGGGEGRPTTARVSGTVTLQGKPLEGATVHFIGEKFAGSGKTNAQGHYELVQGAVPGKNKVYITKRPLPSNVNLDPQAGVDLEQLNAAVAAGESDQSGNAAKIQAPKEEVPEEFSSPQKSTLTLDVPPGGTTTADFRL